MNLNKHYQWIQSGYGMRAVFTCHEAYSENRTLVAINPVPVEPKDIDQDNAMELDLERHGLKEFKYAKKYIEAFHEMMDLEESVTPVFEDEDIDEDGIDSRGNVIDIVDFMKRNR